MNWIARIFMLLLGLVVLTALLLGLLCYVIYAAVRWLLTGRKPQVVMVWQQFSAMRKSFSQGEFRAGFQNPRGRNAPFARDDQVQDVQAREVDDNAPRLPHQK
jgi:hypothetical protein